MGGPSYGALGATFTAVRALQTISFIGIIGMTANFIAEMVNDNIAPQSVLVGTLSITCIGVLYCAITFILYWDNILPFLANTAMDFLLLIALTVVAVTVGKPLSYMNCMAIGNTSGGNSGGNISAFTDSLRQNLNKDYGVWVGASRTTCFEMKSIWGLSIALCILFAFSMISSVCLWKRNKAASAPAGKGMV